MGTQLRLTWIDTAKGIAIICVVYGHCLRGLTKSGFISAADQIQIMDYVIYVFHMPLFFVASGLFFASSLNRGKGSFWRGRLQTILYPYLFWSMTQGAVQVLVSGTGATNQGMDFERLRSILWEPISPFWFLYALFFAHIVAAALIRVRSSLIVILALAAFLLSTQIAPGVIQDVSYGLLYLALGMLIREYGLLPMLPASALQTSCLVVTFVGLSLVAYSLNVPERLAVFGSIVGVVAIGAVGALLDRSNFARPFAAFLRLCGQHSMGIFVLHILVLGLTRTVMVWALHVGNGSLLLVVGTALGVLVPLGIQFATVRLGIHAWVGLPASATSARGHSCQPA
jgi:fucose 4-O-acetylase-like acetyltransferase